MEELEQPAGSPALMDNEEPEGNNDPGDPLRPGIEEDGGEGRVPPMADPRADLEAEEPDRVAEEPDNMDNDDDADEGDADSELEELDEAQFDDFDPEAANINVPVQVDETNVAQLGVHKRKRTDDEERERKKKKKEGRREKVSRKKKTRAAGPDEDDFEGGVEMDGKRARKSKASGVRRLQQEPENEDELTPEERRRRALDRKMDEALKTNKTSRRRGGGIDIEAAGDAELESMRHLMAKACENDAAARSRNEPAQHKLKLLPQVKELLNRNTLRGSIVDPDINILEAVRFFLEPADVDAALPNYEIQREIFAVLGKLHMTKEALLASKLGMVIRFYTQSRQPQPNIKRQAEKLLENWMRVILNKRKEQGPTTFQTKTYDPIAAMASQRSGASQVDRSAVAAERRRKALEQPNTMNRARVEGGLSTYTVAPVNNLSNVVGQSSRGASGDAFRRIQARAAAKTAGSKR